MERKIRFEVAVVLILALFIIGCGGGGGDPVSPVDNDPPPGNNPPPPDNNPPPPGSPPVGRQLWGMWNVNFDENSLQVSADPIQDVDAYFEGVDPNILAASSNAIDVKLKSYDPATRVLDLEVNVANPHGDAAYDVRAVVYTDEAGHELRNPEGWTVTFDIPGGRDVNPFKVYAKEEGNRAFVPGVVHTETYSITIPDNFASEVINVAVDGSWYEGGDDPVYAVENFRHTEIYDDGHSFSEVFVDIRDPNGAIDSVNLEAETITGEYLTPLESYYGNTWRTIIKNNLDVPVGDYEVKINASAFGSGAIAIHDYNTIEVVKEYGWVQTWGGISGGNEDSPVFGDRARGVAVDHLGNVYVTGTFHSSIDFNPGPETEMHYSNGEYDIFLSKFDSGGNYMWARTWGGAYSEYGDSIVCDSDGNVWLTGRYQGAIDFDPGPGTDMHTADSKDVFLCKYTPQGDFDGAFTWGGPGDDYGYDIDVDNYGFVYIAGNYESICDFNPGPGFDYHTSDGGDVFVSKFDSNGFFQWARTWGGPEWDFAEGVEVDEFNNVYVVGNIYGPVDLNPGPGVDTESPGELWDAFLVALDAEGDYRWGIAWGGEGWDFGYGITTDSYGSVYVSGDFQYRVDFDPGWDEFEIEVGFEHYGYLSKFDRYGDFLWVRALGGEVIYQYCCEPILDLETDHNDNVYLVGWYEGLVEFPGPGGGALESNGGRDAYLAKFEPDGGCLWAFNIGGPSRDEGFGVDIDSRGNTYCAGFFYDTVDFNPGSGTAERTSNGFDDIWLSKFLPDGEW